MTDLVERSPRGRVVRTLDSNAGDFMRCTALLIVCIITSAVSSSRWGDLSGDGRKGRKIVYEASRLCPGDKEIHFSTELEQVLFLLNSVQNRYKVLRVRILNGCPQTLALSSDDDQVEIRFANGSVRGTLDLSTADPALWASLGEALRKSIVYPARVEANEEENVFVFVGSSHAKDIPASIQYTVRSLHEPIELRTRGAAAR